MLKYSTPLILVCLVATVSKLCLASIAHLGDLRHNAEQSAGSRGGAIVPSVRVIDSSGALASVGLVQVSVSRGLANDFGTICGMNSVSQKPNQLWETCCLFRPQLMLSARNWAMNSGRLPLRHVVAMAVPICVARLKPTWRWRTWIAVAANLIFKNAHTQSRTPHASTT